jgi:hypothetical protein
MEFGLLIVPFALLLLGMLDMGYQMYLRSTLQGAINDVARSAVVQNPDLAGTGTTEAKIKAAIIKRMGGLSGVDPDINIASFDSYSRVNVPEKLLNDANGNGEVDPGDCWVDLEVNGEHDLVPQRSGIGGADDIALYTARMSMKRILPIAGLVGLSPNYNITVEAAVRNQPFANQATPPTACEPSP